MKINKGDAVVVTVASSNSSDPPISLQWKPVVNTVLTITLTAPDGATEVRTAHVSINSHH